MGSKEKAGFCKALGADHAILYRDEDFEEAAMTLTNGDGVDVVLDMVGGEYLNKNIRLLRPGGRHVSIAFLKGSKAEIDAMPIMRRRLTLTGSTLRPQSNAYKGAIADALREKVWPLIAAGKIKPAVHTILPLERASEAHALMQSSEHMGKIILEIE